MPSTSEHEAVDERSLVQRILDLLQHRTGFALVMATRVLDDDWRVVASTTSPYAVVPGDVFRWSDSVCSRMVGSDRPAPWLVEDLDADLTACSAPIRTREPIGAYLGAPLRGTGGDLLGTLCAIDPTPRSASGDASALELAADLVAWAFERASGDATERRRAERSLVTDDVTAPVLDRRQWDRLLELELERTRWSGETITVALGRAVRPGSSRSALTGTAAHLAGHLGDDDAVAVLGSNRLGVLTIGSTPDLDAPPFAEDLTRLHWVASTVTGATTAAAVTDELEVHLVGAGPATARAASTRLTYDFCDVCGRKGRHRLRNAAGHRCRYCQAVELEPLLDASSERS